MGAPSLVRPLRDLDFIAAGWLEPCKSTTKKQAQPVAACTPQFYEAKSVAQFQSHSDVSPKLVRAAGPSDHRIMATQRLVSLAFDVLAKLLPESLGHRAQIPGERQSPLFR